MIAYGSTNREVAEALPHLPADGQDLPGADLHQARRVRPHPGGGRGPQARHRGIVFPMGEPLLFLLVAGAGVAVGLARGGGA
jgi:hypothetical protein